MFYFVFVVLDISRPLQMFGTVKIIGSCINVCFDKRYIFCYQDVHINYVIDNELATIHSVWMILYNAHMLSEYFTSLTQHESFDTNCDGMEWKNIFWDV